HELVQAYEGDYLFDSIHALLHRQEGDAFNADWWYKRLGKRVPTMGIEEELAQIEEEILKN
ncbi:MAG TPA: hypothetical protein PKD85_17485, partial [Saprospiraceae bacterium]|nr:hypothetical protein [Saprospiraceae bacterium]